MNKLNWTKTEVLEFLWFKVMEEEGARDLYFEIWKFLWGGNKILPCLSGGKRKGFEVVASSFGKFVRQGGSVYFS